MRNSHSHGQSCVAIVQHAICARTGKSPGVHDKIPRHSLLLLQKTSGESHCGMYDSKAEPVVYPTTGTWDSWVQYAQRKPRPDFEGLPVIYSPTKDIQGRNVVFLAPCYFTQKQKEKELIATLGFCAEKFTALSIGGDVVLGVAFTPYQWTALKDPDFTWLEYFLSAMPLRLKRKIVRYYFFYPSVTTSGFVRGGAAMGGDFIEKYFVPTKLSEFSDLTMMGEERNKLSMFPQVCLKAEAVSLGTDPPPIFGASIEELSMNTGKDARNCKGVPETLIVASRAIESNEVIVTRDLLMHQSDAGPLYLCVGDLEGGETADRLRDNVPALVTAFLVFLQSLPEPLLGHHAFTEFQQVAGRYDYEDIPANDQRALLRRLLQKISPAAAESIKYLITFCDAVLIRQRENLMTTAKLADSLAAVFMRPENWTKDTPKACNSAVDFINLLIDEAHSTFPGLELTSTALNGSSTEEESSSEEEESSPERKPAKPSQLPVVKEIKRKIQSSSSEETSSEDRESSSSKETSEEEESSSESDKSGEESSSQESSSEESSSGSSSEENSSSEERQKKEAKR